MTTSCRNFTSTVELVNSKLATIPPSTIVGLWRHSILELMKYVQLQAVHDEE